MRKRMIILLLALMLCIAGCADKKGAGAAAPSEEPICEAPSEAAAYCRVTVHYVSDEGFIVPVTKLIPREEGIAKACLSYMISTPENVSAARELGLYPSIPDGARLSLSIADGNALADIGGMSALPSREAELAMIESVVNTLTGFPTINTVTITRDGRGGTLENGTELPVRQKAYALNPEDGELAASAGGESLTLYFPNSSGALTVPVTRIAGGRSLYSLASALVGGPASKGLLGCFPEGTLLLGATLENGVVTVNLSDDFRRVSETEGLFTLCHRTTWLTLKEGFDFDRLKFQVNGLDYAPEEVSAPYEINAPAR